MNSYIRSSAQSGLTDSDILDIRVYASNTGDTTTNIGENWNIDRTTAGRIINRTTWAHVPSPKQVGNYSIYPDGRVFSKAAGKFMQTTMGRDGLQYVELRTGGTREKVAVAALVAKAFLGTKSRNITFINGNSRDAHFTNLAISK